MAETDETDIGSVAVPSDVAAHIEDFKVFVANAIMVIETKSHPDVMFVCASKLMDELLAAQKAVGKLRADTAEHIMRSEGLSLAGLAKRLGVSKPRADQLVRVARGLPPRKRATE